MGKEFYSDFVWHSAIGIDSVVDGHKRFCTRLPNTRKARSMFFRAAGDGKLLIHRTTQALWRVSEDGGSIEPVFDTDVLTEEDLAEGFSE